MATVSTSNRTGRLRSTSKSKYDVHHKVLSQTYGALADLRRELSDSKAAVAEREELLRNFGACQDSQRAWLILEDYFEKLSLSRRDFPATDWWPHMLALQGDARLEELAFLFLRAKRPLPTELASYANLERFAARQEAEREQQMLRAMEEWLCPPAPAHLDSPRVSLRVVCQPCPDSARPAFHRLALRFYFLRSQTGEKAKTLREIVELVTRSQYEKELYPPADWEFMCWVAETHNGRDDGDDTLLLSDIELLHWLAR